MKENSPIWARLAEMVHAVVDDRPKARTSAKAAIDLPNRMMPSVAASSSGASSTIDGSNSMPTETKNNTAKASRSGSVSSADRCDRGDSPRIMPAKNAPSANEISNSATAP
jgi:hypothetical protein